MKTRGKRKLAILLTLLMVVTSVLGNHASVTAFAADEVQTETASDPQPTPESVPEATEQGTGEETPDPAAAGNTSEDTTASNSNIEDLPQTQEQNQEQDQNQNQEQGQNPDQGQEQIQGQGQEEVAQNPTPENPTDQNNQNEQNQTGTPTEEQNPTVTVNPEGVTPVEENEDFITIFYEATEGGTVSAASERINPKLGQQQAAGSTAQAKEGYRFLYWQTADQSAVMSFDLSWQPMIWGAETADITYAAVFEKTEEEVVEEVAEEEVAMPFFEADGSTYEMSVRVTAPEGTFPAGTTMKVRTASKSQIKKLTNELVGEDVEVVDAIGVDITFIYEEEEIQPANGNTVDVTLTAKREVKGDSHLAVHVDGDEAEIVADANEKVAEVEAESFSTYAIIGTITDTPTIQDDDEKIPTRTYYFYNGDTLLDAYTQRIKSVSAESVSEPAIPEHTDATMSFVGWFTAATGGMQYTGFGTPETFEESEAVNLYARFEKRPAVVFYRQDGTVFHTIVKSTAGDAAEAIAIDAEKITYTVGTSAKVVGWSETESGAEAVTSVSLTTEDIFLYPIIQRGTWVSFYGNGEGASYTDRQFVLPGGKLTKPADPKRPGYIFGGWYRNAACSGNAYDFNSNSTALPTDGLYAKWTAGTATYTLNVYVEEFNGDGTASSYSLVGVYPNQSATSGTKVNNLENTAKNKAGNLIKAYHEFDSAASDTEVVVNGDGSTVINARFKLKTYTIKFDLDNQGWWYNGRNHSQDGRQAKMVVNGVEKNTGYDFDARVGEDISAKWPSGVLVNRSWGENENSVFVGWSTNGVDYSVVTKRFTFLPQMIPASNPTVITWKAGYVTSGVREYKVEYYLEAPDGKYYVSEKYSQEYNNRSYSTLTGKEINGYRLLDEAEAPDGYPAVSEGEYYG